MSRNASRTIPPSGISVPDVTTASVPQANTRWVLAAKIFIGLFFALYVSIRVITVPLTNDEWGSMVDHYRMVAVMTNQHSSQVHFLSAFLSTICLNLLPGHEVLAIRLPALLGLALYLTGAWIVTRRTTSPWFGVVCFAGFLANAFMLDFFGLSRGYGPALGFTMMSIAFLLPAFDRRGVSAAPLQPHATACIWMALLAVLSNLGFLNFYLAVCGVLFLFSWMAMRQASGRHPKLLDLISRNGYLLDNLVILSVFYVPRIMLYNQNRGLMFSAGGDRGFVEDTVSSLVRVTAYDFRVPESIVFTVGWILTALATATCVMALVQAWRARQWTAGALAATLLLGFFALTEIMHAFFRAPYVTDRTALAVVPLFFLLMTAHLGGPVPPWARRLWAGVLAAYIAVAIANFNLAHTYSWRETSDNRSLLDRLQALHASTGKPIVMGMSDGCKYTTWYYAEKNLGLKEDARTKDNGFVKMFGWLVIYSVDYGVPAGGALHFLPETTHLFIQNSAASRIAALPVRPIADYRTARCRLYERSSPVTPKEHPAVP